MKLESLDNCELYIGNYPKFLYDASGGGGNAIMGDKSMSGLRTIKFYPTSFIIPPLNFHTTKILGLPMPPGLKIDISVQKLSGVIDESRGTVSLEFESNFTFSILSLIKAPKLLIKTSLSTNNVIGKFVEVKGATINRNRKATLVGMALVEPTGNKFLDKFLDLPNQAIAKLNCKFMQ